jgi:hypothetical protein
MRFEGHNLTGKASDRPDSAFDLVLCSEPQAKTVKPAAGSDLVFQYLGDLRLRDPFTPVGDLQDLPDLEPLVDTACNTQVTAQPTDLSHAPVPPLQGLMMTGGRSCGKPEAFLVLRALPHVTIG